MKINLNKIKSYSKNVYYAILNKPNGLIPENPILYTPVPSHNILPPNNKKKPAVSLIKKIVPIKNIITRVNKIVYSSPIFHTSNNNVKILYVPNPLVSQKFF